MKILVMCAFVLLTQKHFSQEINLPELNQKILEFVNKNIGKKVDRGECWDLAAIPLKENQAKWDNLYQFGKKLNHKIDPILPGDIIQFKNVKIKIVQGNQTIVESYQHHTAVIYEVKSKTEFKIAQQNTSHKGKKVSIDDLLLENVISGTYTIYRPEK